MSTPHATPADLAEAGYRIEHGLSTDGELANRYWWTWSFRSGLDASTGDWPTAKEAIADARRDMEENADGA